MFNIFGKSKKILCSVCGADSQTNKIIYFDPTDRGRHKELGVPEYVCLNHLREKWEKQLRQYRGFSICFLPCKGYNSYSYTTMDRTLNWGVTKKSQEELIRLANKYRLNPKCSSCSGSGKFGLFNNTYPEREEFFPKVEPTILCEKHFIDRILQEIESHDLKIDEIGGAFGETGVYMQGEY